jgi:hypothetical protein
VKLTFVSTPFLFRDEVLQENIEVSFFLLFIPAYFFICFIAAFSIRIFRVNGDVYMLYNGDNFEAQGFGVAKLSPN